MAILADTDEIYNITKLAFIETLELAGIPICFNHDCKLCIARPIDRIAVVQTAGVLLEATTQVDMLDDDFNAWAGIDNLSLVDIAELTLQILTIRSKPSNPIVHLMLKKDK
jgi:hypothetical protein